MKINIDNVKNNDVYRKIICITLVYVAAHWFLLVATGRWWDDWVYADKNWDYLLEVMKQSSLPLSAFADGSNWLFPDGFYRILVFCWYYIAAILFFKILNTIEYFSEDACLWITLLSITIPVFDARILWIMYPYALGMPLFLGGFYVAVSNDNINSKNGIAKRILSLILLMLSYCFLQSAMLLVLLLVLYLCILELRNDWDWKNIKRNIARLIRTGLHYLDFLFEPIIWYFGSKMLFPGYGAYGEVYYISWAALPGIIFHSPLNAYFTLKGIVLSYLNVLNVSHASLYLLSFIVVIYATMMMIRIKKYNARYGSSNSIIFDFIMTLLGCVVFFLSFFPYAIKRDAAIGNTYIAGRDTVLLGLGTAILLYYLVHTIFRGIVPKMIMLSLITLGIIHFNFMYLDWQEAYYQQVQLQHEIAQNDEIKGNDTFLIMYRGALICSNFYQTNGNSWAATGEETRYYMPGTTSLSGLIEMDDDAWMLNAYGMNEYQYGDKIVDGVIFVDYMDIGRRTILKQKWNELFRPEAFDSWIDDIRNIKYVSISKEESDKLLDMYSLGELTDDMIYEMYY